ncbi:MAG: citrate/2-methylcitrate synthase [Deltaproteobacteria bacterium]|nr:citrate/2-methylcitrate synthase [Deltaproteobacteria bacterium]
MTEVANVKNTGLRGVTVADAKISFIDGEKGVLIYRGYRIEELAEKPSFMEVAFLILNGHLPRDGELEEFQAVIRDLRHIPGYMYESTDPCPQNQSLWTCFKPQYPFLPWTTQISKMTQGRQTSGPPWD